MTTETKRPGAHQFVAFEHSLEIIAGLRQIVSVVRRCDVKIAQQIVSAASSVAANALRPGDRAGRRQGRVRYDGAAGLHRGRGAQTTDRALAQMREAGVTLTGTPVVAS